MTASPCLLHPDLLPLPVWGTTAAGQEVKVRIAGQARTAKVGADGTWSVRFDPLKAGGP